MTTNLTHIGELDSGALSRDDLAWAAEVCTRAAASAAAAQATRLEAILRSAEHCLSRLASGAEVTVGTGARRGPHPEQRTPERMEQARKVDLARGDAA